MHLQLEISSGGIVHGKCEKLQINFMHETSCAHNIYPLKQHGIIFQLWVNIIHNLSPQKNLGLRLSVAISRSIKDKICHQHLHPAAIWCQSHGPPQQIVTPTCHQHPLYWCQALLLQCWKWRAWNRKSHILRLETVDFFYFKTTFRPLNHCKNTLLHNLLLHQHNTMHLYCKTEPDIAETATAAASI